MIENNLRGLIQFPIEGLTIVPVPMKGRAYLFVIEVPPSLNPPHRVKENKYYQRYNFSTEELKHFQIMDIVGKRRRPNVDKANVYVTPIVESHKLKIEVHFLNTGHTVAKFFTCLLNIPIDVIFGNLGHWKSIDAHCIQFSYASGVLYPQVLLTSGEFEIILGDQRINEIPITLSFMAEDMEVINLKKKIQFDETGELIGVVDVI